MNTQRNVRTLLRASSKNVSRAVLVFLFFFSFWLMFHTFGYDGKGHTILIASKLWSDFGAHIPLIRSFSLGDNLGLLLQGRPEYPIFPGEPIRYHFLFYAFVGLLERMGLRLDWALNLPSALGFALLLWGIWSLAIELSKDKRVAALSVLFFLFNGSLSFLKFFTQHPLSLDTPLDIIRANAFPAFGPWDDGEITAFWNLNIYTNQRHLAIAFAIGIWFLVWVIKNERHVWRKNILGAIFWGVLIGMLPYFHQPTLLIIAILMCSSFLFFSRLRFPLLVAGSVGLILVAPQILTMPKSESLMWYPGYFIHDQLSLKTFLSFWFQNLGFHALLIPIGFFLIPHRAKKLLVPLFFISMIGNLFKFSVEIAANHKFFNFALILGNMISAYTVILLVKQCNNVTMKKLGVTLKGVVGTGLIGVLIVSGVIDFFVVFNDQKGGVADVEKSDVVTWIATNTPASSVFLNSSYIYHPASLAGRKIFLGWPYFAWSAGYDTNTRLTQMQRMYESEDPMVVCKLFTTYHISYVTIDKPPVIQEVHFPPSPNPSILELVYEIPDKTFQIYRPKASC